MSPEYRAKYPEPAPKPRLFSAVRASFLAGIVERFEAKGSSAQPILNRLAINPAQLDDTYAEIPLAQFVRFLEEAAQAVGDIHLGAQIGAELKAGDMGPVGIILSLSTSIDVGLTRFVRYANALQSETENQWVNSDRDMIFTYRLTDAAIWPRRQDAEFSLAMITQVLRNNFTSRWSPREVHFEHAPPKDQSDLERLFRCPIQYRQPANRLIARRADCTARLRKEDPDLMGVLERHVSDLAGAKPAEVDVYHGTSAVIDANLGLTPISLEFVAQALGLSPRSLQRKLALEGTSLRQILEARRRELAQMLLSQPGAKVLRVSEALGYSDPTAFWRAYRKWTGKSPSDWNENTEQSQSASR